MGRHFLSVLIESSDPKASIWLSKMRPFGNHRLLIVKCGGQPKVDAFWNKMNDNAENPSENNVAAPFEPLFSAAWKVYYRDSTLESSQKTLQANGR